MQVIYPTGHKTLCNGYVTDTPFLLLKQLIINILLCNGYVISNESFYHSNLNSELRFHIITSEFH